MSHSKTLTKAHEGQKIPARHAHFTLLTVYAAILKRHSSKFLLQTQASWLIPTFPTVPLHTYHSEVIFSPLCFEYKKKNAALDQKRRARIGSISHYLPLKVLAK